MLNENRKFVIVLILLVVIVVLNLFDLLWSEVEGVVGQENYKAKPVATDDPSLRQPGGYHYGWVKLLATGAQKKINTDNPNLDLKECEDAYWKYYSRQTEEEAQKALLTIHNCEK